MKKRNIHKTVKQFIRLPIKMIKKLFMIQIPSILYKKMHNKYDGKKIILTYPPKYVTIAISGYCMNACEFCSSHCIDSKRNEFSNHQYNIPFSMTYDEFCRIVDLCYYAKVPHVHIVAAGEPFLHKEIFKMMDYLISKYISITLQTNFNKKIFQNKKLFQELIKRKDFIISITTDIFPPDVHNKIKKGSDYNFVMSSLKYLGEKTDIIFDVHTILTKTSYKNMDKLVMDLYQRNVQFVYNVVNLHPHNFNDYTSPDNIYSSNDTDISRELEKLKKLGKRLNIQINFPPTWDQAWKLKNGNCLTFWSRFQVVPDKKLPKEKWIGNIIPSQCNAVVIGDLFSLGNIFEYENLMDFWNNKQLINIRKNLINRKYPDEKCRTCYKSDKINFLYSCGK